MARPTREPLHCLLCAASCACALGDPFIKGSILFDRPADPLVTTAAAAAPRTLFPSRSQRPCLQRASHRWQRFPPSSLPSSLSPRCACLCERADNAETRPLSLALSVLSAVHFQSQRLWIRARRTRTPSAVSVRLDSLSHACSSRLRAQSVPITLFHGCTIESVGFAIAPNHRLRVGAAGRTSCGLKRSNCMHRSPPRCQRPAHEHRVTQASACFPRITFTGMREAATQQFDWIGWRGYGQGVTVRPEYEQGKRTSELGRRSNSRWNNMESLHRRS